MTNKSSNSVKLPQMPVVERKPNTVEKRRNADYYTKTQVAAMRSRFSGKGRELEVTISRQEFEELDSLKALFGSDFGVNQVICLAFNSIEKGMVHRSLLEHLSELANNKKTLKVKPSEDSLTAIITMGKENSASILTRIGIHVLYERLSMAQYDS